jgi:SAM-dependent methyltransferase
VAEPDARTADLAAVQDAYTAWSPAYIDLFGAAAKAAPEDRERITAWARGLAGPVLDAGSGPGHWSAHLAALGVDVEGVDATPAFVEHARRAFPGIPFSRADLRELDREPGSLGGVLAWFSLIHTDPSEVPAVLRRFARMLRPDGGLLLGAFTGPALAAFEHRVVRAWAWPVADLVAAIEGAGLRVVDQRERVEPTGRVTAAIEARLLPL